MKAIEILSENIHHHNQPDIMQALRDFLPLAMRELEITKLPKIKLEKHIDDQEQPTFGRFVNDEVEIHLGIANRHPIDILRTLAHELVHFKQYLENKLGPNSGETGSPEENEAHEVAGVIMRHFNKQHPDYFYSEPLDLPIKRESINQENMDHEKDDQAVPELKAALLAKKEKLQSVSDDQVYDIIDKIMTRIARAHGISGQKLHNMWVAKYKQIPDTWIMNENFADGKKPGRKGLAKRSGVNCKASVTQLRKVAKNSSGERARMAHWCANMKQGRSK